MESSAVGRGLPADASRSLMIERTFRDAVCERCGIPPDRYQAEVFWRCVFPATRPLVRLLWWLHPAYFRQDLELIESVAECTSLPEFRSELNSFRFYYRPRGVGRRLLHLRVSGQRLLKLAAQVFQG